MFVGFSLTLTSFINYAEVTHQPEALVNTVQSQTPQQRLLSLSKGYQKTCTSDECHLQLKQLKKYGRWGDAKTQLVLGTAYLYGDGVEQDIEKSINWLKRTAYNESSNAGKYSLKAFHMMATLYQDGIGVEQDQALATKYLNKLADKHYGPVLFDRAFIEFDQDNITQGIHLLKQASDNRFSEASYFLARMYHQGDYIEKDIQQSAIYYEKIVKSDYKDSRQRLKNIIAEMEVSVNKLAGHDVTQEQALIKKLNATLNIEIINVNFYTSDTKDPMTNVLAGLRQNSGQFSAATGSRIKGRGCNQTSHSCRGLNEEDIEDTINERSTSTE
jgi:hypothetical protein